MDILPSVDFNCVTFTGMFFFKSPERDGSNKLGHTLTIMTVDMYINNFVNMYYIFTLFNWERKAVWYKKLHRKPESYVLYSAIITN